MIKTIQVKLHNLSNYKNMLLNKTIKNYNIVYNKMLKLAYNSIDIIKNEYSDKNGNYKAQTISKFFSGKDYHKQYGLEPLYDALKADVSASIASYLELLEIQENAEFPYIKTNNKQIIKQINELNYKILNDSSITNEEQHNLEQQTKEYMGIIKRNKKLLPISYCRYDESREGCLLYNPKTNKYYAKLHIMGRKESKKMFENYVPKKQDNKEYDALYLIPSFMQFNIDYTKPVPYVIVPLEFGKWQEQYLKLARDGKAKISAFKLVKRDNDFYLDIPIDVPTTNMSYKPITKCGIDMGVINLATIAITDKDNKCIHTKTFNRDEIKINGISYEDAICNYMIKLSSAQSNGKNKLPLDKKFIDGYLHMIANEIIKICIEHKSQIYVEDLTKMDKSKAKVFNSKKFENYSKKAKYKIIKNVNQWAYGQIQQILIEKCKRYNLVEPKKINPKFTSENCSSCGHNEVISSKGQNRNRETQDKFICKKCGFSINADINAAINIANYYDKATILKANFEEGRYVVKHKQFKFEGVGDSEDNALLDFIQKLKEYKVEYDKINKDEKKKGSNLAKQYAILKKLESEDYERNFVLAS